MRVVDTSAWIEFLVGSQTGAAVADALPQKESWVVPTIVQLELTKWLTRQAGEDKSDEVVAFSQTCIVAPLDTKIALSAASLCVAHRLATADAIVYATALRYGAELITCDAHFKQLPGVVSLPKR